MFPNRFSFLSLSFVAASCKRRFSSNITNVRKIKDLKQFFVKSWNINKSLNQNNKFRSRSKEISWLFTSVLYLYQFYVWFFIQNHSVLISFTIFESFYIATIIWILSPLFRRWRRWTVITITSWNNGSFIFLHENIWVSKLIPKHLYMLILNHVAIGKVKIEMLKQLLNCQFRMICWKMPMIHLPPRKCGVPLEMAM